MNSSAGYYLAPGHLELLRATGPDTGKFLQGQLTCDVNALQPWTCTPGAACTNKGRVIATFTLCRLEDEYVMIMAGGLATLLHKHLDKYRPFYKCTLTVETGTLTGIGTANPGDPALPAPGHINQVEDGWVCRIPGSVPRVVALESTSGQSVWLETRKQQFAQSGPTRWQEDDLLSGIFPLSIDDTERYTPQEIHLDRCDFISFSKGCYTGQEIVARMHYKSKPKRQLYLLTLNIPADQPSASEIEVLDQSGETLGKSIKAVPATDNRLLVLVPLPIQDTAGSEALQTAQDPQPEVRIF